MHRSAALRALRLFSAGSVLHDVGRGKTLTHADLIREKYVIFMTGPQRYAERMRPYYALHLLAFMEAILAGAGPVELICDEFTNAPLKALVSGLTVMRAAGGNCHIFIQSRSELQRKYGEKETQTIEDNAIVKQWFGGGVLIR